MHYAGKKGFIPVSASKDPGRTINLLQLSSLVDRLVAEKKVQLVGDKVVVDLKELGFRKLLGSGSISRAVQVKVEKCSEGAAKKLKDAGGDLLSIAPAK
jgi:large subunit ribosomal protein L15